MGEEIKNIIEEFGFDNLDVQEKQRIEEALGKEDNFKQLIELKNRLEQKKFKIWSTHLMGEVTGLEWERIITELYNKIDGMEAIQTQDSRDGGKDILVWNNDKLIFVEIKDWKSGFDLDSIRSAINAAQEIESEELEDESVDELHAIAPRGFTKPAKNKANRKRKINVRLIDGMDLLYLLNKYDVETPKIK